MPSCVSCHRALKAAQGLLVICARCSALTCAICSRTCTACPSSMPPTPYLTRSPTPEPHPPSPPSPKRPALVLHSENTNRGEKRRKNTEEDSREGFLEILAEFDLAPGCGRTRSKRKASSEATAPDHKKGYDSE
ncbi:hypothetical protein C0989_002075 [Termitomyces sp. Mn162]|nr:hypothetical protein C0989_002075 [Termitomyces sp. Mn162]